ncbi:MAG: hypothetical protein ACR652_22655 [Methylocystis sp.]|uniref:hypothetical protein n=1 Tax=Methylocystis sp. TaxID=1911079 RepID=UPI003DA4A64B
MLKHISLGFIAATLFAALFAAPASARDSFGVDNRRTENHYAAPHRHNRSGAWIGANHGRFGGPHGQRWGGAHDHFSPRGQGGHHWGW